MLYGTDQEQEYYGLEATIEVDGFTLDVTENSGAALILKNRQGFNYFSVGWHVSFN